ncbi:hypothetical protein OQA88_8231 [Cercophora sp. LCS_1]
MSGTYYPIAPPLGYDHPTPPSNKFKFHNSLGGSFLIWGLPAVVLLGLVFFFGERIRNDRGPVFTSVFRKKEADYRSTTHYCAFYLLGIVAALIHIITWPVWALGALVWWLVFASWARLYVRAGPRPGRMIRQIKAILKHDRVVPARRCRDAMLNAEMRRRDELRLRPQQLGRIYHDVEMGLVSRKKAEANVSMIATRKHEEEEEEEEFIHFVEQRPPPVFLLQEPTLPNRSSSLYPGMTLPTIHEAEENCVEQGISTPQVTYSRPGRR